MIQFDEHVFQMDWFNHQLVIHPHVQNQAIISHISSMPRPFSGTGTALTILDYGGQAERERQYEMRTIVGYFNVLRESNGSNNMIYLLHGIPTSYSNLGGGSKHFWKKNASLGEMIQFDQHICFKIGTLNL